MAGASKNAHAKTAPTGDKGLALGTTKDLVVRRLDIPSQLWTESRAKKTGWKKNKAKALTLTRHDFDVLAKDAKGEYLTESGYVDSGLMDPWKTSRRDQSEEAAAALLGQIIQDRGV